MPGFFLQIPASFSVFRLFLIAIDRYEQIFLKTLPMLGFEPQISDVGSNRSANCATTTTLNGSLFKILYQNRSCKFFTYDDSPKASLRLV